MNQELCPHRSKIKCLYDPKGVSPFKVGRADGENAFDILEEQLKAPSRVLDDKDKPRAT